MSRRGGAFLCGILCAALLVSGGAAATDAPGLTVSETPGRISLDLKGIDIIEALKILSTRGNFNLVANGNIQGRITLFLKDVDVQDALDILLQSSGLAYERKGDILYVMPQQDYEIIYGEAFTRDRQVKVVRLRYAKASQLAKNVELTKSRIGKIIVDEVTNSLVLIDSESVVQRISMIIESLDKPTESRVFTLRNAKAEDLKPKIQELLTKDLGTVQIDDRTNKISVSDIPSKLDEAEKIVKAFDEKPREVLIEAKIVEVRLNDRFKLGVDWQEIFTKIQKDYSFRSNFRIDSPNTFTSDIFPSGAELTIGTFGRDDYSMLVQALKTVGDTNLLSSPRITAISNQEAKILVGESRPYATNTVVTPSAGATTTASTLSFLDIGVKLFVTPKISDDGFVTMKIKPEVSSAGDNYTYGDPATTVPIVSTTQAETSVRVKDGTTIIIAGLVKDERSGDVSKVPLFGDIPVLGHLFKKTDHSVAKNEIVIFITPHIISGENDYLEVPQTPPTGESKFTVSEDWTYERRRSSPMDPGIYEAADDSAPEGPSPKKGVQRLSLPSSQEEYFYMLKDRILNQIHLTAPRQASAGSVELSFDLNSKGELIAGPRLIKSSSKSMGQAASDAVILAAPFPVFPGSMRLARKTFTMEFRFE